MRISLSTVLTHDPSILANRYRSDLSRVNAGREQRDKQENPFSFPKFRSKSSLYTFHEKDLRKNVSSIRLSKRDAGHAWPSMPEQDAGTGNSSGGLSSGKHDVNAHDTASIEP